jgi:hypothetical protein
MATFVHEMKTGSSEPAFPSEKEEGNDGGQHH